MLIGLYFNVLLWMSWIKKASAVLGATEGIVSVNGKKLNHKPNPEPAIFLSEKGVRVVSLPCYHLGRMWVFQSAIK